MSVEICAKNWELFQPLVFGLNTSLSVPCDSTEVRYLNTGIICEFRNINITENKKELMTKIFSYIKGSFQNLNKSK